MGVEIERKFVVGSLEFLAGVETLATPMRQGYLTPPGGGPAVRVRLEGHEGRLTIKGPSSEDGLVRAEFEYEVPFEDAEAMLALCVSGVIDKVRYSIEVDDLEWVVDVFEGANEGLVLAEVELSREDEEFEVPEWAGEEVTGDPRYYNSSLAAVPYGTW